MIFQTEKQLKEFGDKLSDDKKKPIEDALEELKKAYETKDIAVIDPALEKLMKHGNQQVRRCIKLNNQNKKVLLILNNQQRIQKVKKAIM